VSRISRRLADIGESATMAITMRAAALRAEGLPVIGFGAGEPDFPTPAHIVEAAIAASADPRNHRYSPAAGLPELREAVAAKTVRDSGYEVEAQNVVITPGGKGAVYGAMAALLDPGDEVILPAPYWVSYPSAAALAGGVAVPVPTTVESGYKVTVEQLEGARTERTKMLVFVSPSNPTGAVYTPEETAAIGCWAVDHGVWVLTDEIYEHLTYGSATFTSMPVVVPELADTCVVVNGVAKTYAMTGWRVGWMVGPPDVTAAVARLQSHSTSNVANVSQRAALAAVTGPMAPTLEMREAFDRRRRVMHRLLTSMEGIVCPEPMGAFYAFPDVTGLLGRPLGRTTPASSMDLAAALLEQANIAVVPGEAFGAPGSLRLSFALSDEDLDEGLTRWIALAAERTAHGG
jgi:aspartate/methionine/tyrosine aminotransferase